MSIDEEAHYQNLEKEGNIYDQATEAAIFEPVFYEFFYSPKCCKITSQIKAL